MSVAVHPQLSGCWLREQCELSMQVELMDERFFKDGELSERNNRQLLAWSNALTRTLSKLGINPTKPKVPALTTIIGVNGAGRLASSMGSRP